MKYSKFTQLTYSLLSYTKVLCLGSILFILIGSCATKKNSDHILQNKKDTKGKQIVITEKAKEVSLNDVAIDEVIKPGAERLYLYLDTLKNKKVAIVGNQTSAVGNSHLVDTLLSLGINVVKVFSPEHGFRGDADAGEAVTSTVDKKTGIPIVSLYGNNKKPKPAQLTGVEVIIFDLQDVGVRFYTYISTLHYIMESAAENDIPVIVLDRPNPNAHYIDGPIRDPEHRSFVGMHPVPIVYGMTIGEYAMMINGEYWLADSVQCELKVVPCKNYNHKLKYTVPIPPSPNLRSDAAIALYPSLCLFEATTVSIGRGTERPFEYYGHPKFPVTGFSFTPISSFGAKNPLWVNVPCNGFDLNLNARKRFYELNINYLIEAKNLLGDSVSFINQNGFFDRLAGTSELRQQIVSGMSAKEIRASWKPGIQQFRKIRSKYLLYE